MLKTDQISSFCSQHWSLNWSTNSVRMKMVRSFTIMLQMDTGTATMDRVMVLMETMDMERAAMIIIPTAIMAIMVMETI